jgi:hypothetical protein
LFAASDSDYGRTNVVKHKIATRSAHPIKQPPRRLPDVLAKEVDKQVKGMLNNEVITPSSSPWSSPVGGCFIGCADLVAILCFTTFVLP